MAFSFRKRDIWIKSPEDTLIWIRPPEGTVECGKQISLSLNILDVEFIINLVGFAETIFWEKINFMIQQKSDTSITYVTPAEKLCKTL